MTAKDLLRQLIEYGHRVTRGFVEDLTDADLLVRSVPTANHIAWQLGHTIASTRRLILAAGRRARIARGFRGGLYQGNVGLGRSGQVRHEGPVSGPDGADESGVAGGGQRHAGGRVGPARAERMRQRMPTVGVVLLMLGAHWTVHAGQFVPIRRKLGKPPLF